MGMAMGAECPAPASRESNSPMGAEGLHGLQASGWWCVGGIGSGPGWPRAPRAPGGRRQASKRLRCLERLCRDGWVDTIGWVRGSGAPLGQSQQEYQEDAHQRPETEFVDKEGYPAMPPQMMV